MNRRKYLLTTATGFAGLAGCMGNQSGTDGDQSGNDGNRTGSGGNPSETTPNRSTQTSRGGGRSTGQPTTDTARTGGGRGTQTTTATTAGASFDLTSSAFENGATIPRTFTCSGANVSPPLAISGVPETAEALAVVVDDPDAGEHPFTHWLLWNLPPDTTKIPMDVPQNRTVSELGGARQGTNDGGGIGYTGPCPPEGDGPHTYRFRLYMLESSLGIEAGAERAVVENALENSATRRTLLRGTFGRR